MVEFFIILSQCIYGVTQISISMRYIYFVHANDFKDAQVYTFFLWIEQQFLVHRKLIGIRTDREKAANIFIVTMHRWMLFFVSGRQEVNTVNEF